MARIQCKCGEILSNVEAPNDIEYIIYGYAQWLSILARDSIDPMIDIPTPSVDFWKCTSCERIYVYKYGEDKPIKIYKIEEDFGGNW